MRITKYCIITSLVTFFGCSAPVTIDEPAHTESMPSSAEETIEVEEEGLVQWNRNYMWEDQGLYFQSPDDLVFDERFKPNAARFLYGDNFFTVQYSFTEDFGIDMSRQSCSTKSQEDARVKCLEGIAPGASLMWVPDAVTDIDGSLKTLGMYYVQKEDLTFYVMYGGANEKKAMEILMNIGASLEY